MEACPGASSDAVLRAQEPWVLLLPVLPYAQVRAERPPREPQVLRELLPAPPVQPSSPWRLAAPELSQEPQARPARQQLPEPVELREP